MSDHIGEPAAEWEPAARHPYAGHPAAAVLADHPLVGNPNRSHPVRCGCWLDDPDRGWTGPACDHAAHLAEVLHRAGLLPDATPPETPTIRVLRDRTDWTAIAERHALHYRTCGCLEDSARCCAPACPCHVLADSAQRGTT